MHRAWLRISSFPTSFITSVAGSMAGWEQEKTLCNIWRWWWVIHIAISTNLRIKNLKKWQHRDSGVGVVKGKKKRENSEIYVNPLGVHWKFLWWKIDIALSETLLKKKSQCCVKEERLAGQLSSLSWFSLFFPWKRVHCHTSLQTLLWSELSYGWENFLEFD